MKLQSYPEMKKRFQYRSGEKKYRKRKKEKACF